MTAATRRGEELIAVIGAGTMGAGIAQVAAAAGHTVLVYDGSEEAIERAVASIKSSLDRRVERGRLTDAEKDLILARLKRTEAIEDIAPAQLVIEAIAENLDVKKGLLRKLESICSTTAVFATNTSSLSITELASDLQHPARVLGLHFFNPAPVMKLVEVVSGRMTSPETARWAAHLATNWGKHCVHTRSSPGFIVNRVARPYYAEALRLLEEQAAAPATIDAIMRESGGFKMGPLELMDLIGHDVNYAVTCSVYDAYYQDPRFKPSLIQKELIDAGFLGRKSGRGFYDYTNGAVVESQSSEAREAPSKVVVYGSLGIANSLVTMIGNAGIEVEQADGAGYLEIGNTFIALTDGRSATERSACEQRPQLVLFDLALDYVSSERIALARADQSEAGSLEQVIGLFQALGKTVSVLDDVPGMAVMRTVCMLANEGADAVNQGVCDVRSVDTAMRYGTGYPLGPLAWADRIGIDYVFATLQHLQQSYGEDRYRASPLLRRKSCSGVDFYA